MTPTGRYFAHDNQVITGTRWYTHKQLADIRNNGIAQNTPEDEVYAVGFAQSYLDEGANPYGQYATDTTTDPTLDSANKRCIQVQEWTDAEDAEKISILESRIADNATVAQQSKLYSLRDPALVGVLDEQTATALEVYDRLHATPSDELDDFDPTFDPADMPAIELARTLSLQESNLAADPATTPAHQADLLAVSAIHQAIVQAGDPAAEVPAPPVFARRLIGIPGEDYGLLSVVRVPNPNDDSQWTLTFKLEFDRELDITGHWVSMYDESAPLDVLPTGSTSGYRSTVSLTQISPGIYEAAATAVADWDLRDVERRVTINNGHIDKPVMPLMVIPAEYTAKKFKVRWGGIASGWVDTGVEVTSIVGAGTYNVTSTTPFENVVADTPSRIGGEETTFIRIHQAGSPGILVFVDHNASAVGNTIFIEQ